MTKEKLNIEYDPWADISDRAQGVVARKYPNVTNEKQQIMTEEVIETMQKLKDSERLKFVQTELEDGTDLKTLEPSSSEKHSDGLPVEAVLELLGVGDSQEFEYGIPSDEWYLQALSNIIDKPIDAFLGSEPPRYIEPVRHSVAA